MKKLFLFFIILSFLGGSVFFACNDKIEVIITCDIFGNVADKTTGEPISVVNVLLTPDGKSFTTGSDGNFSFPELELMDLKEKVYTIQIEKEGYKSDSKVVTVKPGENPIEVNFTIERIPAYITADKDTLSFGNGEENVKSFSIVNPGYEDMKWHVEYDCPWIKSVRDSIGVLKHGETQSIVVNIDREKLQEGENKTSIVFVSSSDGSAQVVVTAIGLKRIKPIVNALEPKDITSSSAVFYGELNDSGHPVYFERGFVYSTSPEPSKSATIEVLKAMVSDDDVFSIRVSDLEYNKKYYVRAYAENEVGITYSNQIDFVASGVKPKVLNLHVSGINLEKRTAVLNATIENVGDPSYTERGFVYDTVANPTISKKCIVEGSGSGAYSKTIENLSLGNTYYVRAYIIGSDTLVYSDEIIFSTDGISPVVSIYPVSNLDLTSKTVMLNGNVDSLGAPEYYEKGFVYGENRYPTIKDHVIMVDGQGKGRYSKSIDIEINKMYYIRSYVKSEIEPLYFYSADEVELNTGAVSPKLSKPTIIKVDYDARMVIINATVESVGSPAYYARGFVYDTVSNPTIGRNIERILEEGSGAISYSGTIKDIKLDKTYYVRAYTESESGLTYSEEISFLTSGTNPVVSIPEIGKIDFTGRMIMLSSVIENIGAPAYYTRGFVYDTVGNPSLERCIEKISVEGTGLGSYSGIINGIKLGKTYYIKSYVINEIGVFYSSQDKVFNADASKPIISMRDVGDINLNNKTTILNATIDFVGAPAYYTRGFVYDTVNNPSIDKCIENIYVAGSGSGSYSGTINGIRLGKTYHVRAYAENEAGIEYSSDVSFSTKGTPPLVTMQDVSELNLSARSVTLNATIEDMGEPTYTKKGFVYAKKNNPTKGDNIVPVDGLGIGKYSAILTGLEIDKTYFVRSYVENETGLFYSEEEKSFSTSGIKPTVVIKEASSINLTNRTAVLNAVIDTVGVPPYSERGFVYGLKNNPTIYDIRVVSPGDGHGGYSETISNLILDTIYYVRAYADGECGLVYSEDVTMFSTKTTRPKVLIQPVSNIDVSTRSVLLNGSVVNVGNPLYIERGFVYGTANTPTIYDNKIVVKGDGSGIYNTGISNLILDQKYYVRAYAMDVNGVVYSSDEVSFVISYISPSIEIKPVTDIDINYGAAVLNASITHVGDPAYSERGFIYGLKSTPVLCDNKIIVEGQGTGDISAAVTGLSIMDEYKIWAYAINEKGIIYSDEETLNWSLSIPTIYSTSVEYMESPFWTVMFKGEITDEGKPKYTERGFVYSTHNTNPTINDEKVVVEGTGTGQFSVQVKMSDVETVYVRAYATNIVGTSYGSATNELPGAEIAPVLPKVHTIDPKGVDLSAGTATLQGKIISKGYPSYVESGFVYSSKTTTPTILDSKITVESDGAGNFSAQATGLPAYETTYIRAYTTSAYGTSYGEIVSVSPNIKILEVEGLMVQSDDIGRNTHSVIGGMCESSKLGGYTDWRLPTISEIIAIYYVKDEVGNFRCEDETSNYWTSSEYSSSRFYFANFFYGVQGNADGESMSYIGRCVRTIQTE